MRKLILLFVTVFLLVSSAAVFAVEEEASGAAVAEDKPLLTKLKDDLLPLPDKMELNVFADTRLGYDNNVELNSRRRGDGFEQGLYSFKLNYKLTDNLNVYAANDIFEILYFNYNKFNILDENPYLGLEWEFLPDLILKAQCAYDYFSYPNNESNTYSGVETKVSLKHKFWGKYFHEFGYENLVKVYPDQKTYHVNLQKGSKDREDWRNGIKYLLGAFLFDRALVKLSNELFWNDSNYEYQKFYSYTAYKIKPSVVYYFTDKFYADTNFTYELKDYWDRRNTYSVTKTVTESIFTFNTALYYDITRNISAVFGYSYSEDCAEDPFYKYSGSIFTWGITLNF